MKLLCITIASVFLIGCVSKSSALQSAVWNGQSGKVEKYLDSGADVNERRDGTTLLHIAALNNRYLIAEQLIAKGAMVNAMDKNGGKPLHVAVSLGHEKIVELLINNGAELNSVILSGKYKKFSFPIFKKSLLLMVSSILIFFTSIFFIFGYLKDFKSLIFIFNPVSREILSPQFFFL